ncbi:efflux RND transporter periplasmic adaptor subunit [Ectothiorhodospira shaposhnikovii]|uniref:efflux RND transporter periplasmic adaptor subunit n=1 Tax=Ectothiorhodospira shaposhnikovii TaxID=1054 RepID=UPI001EE93100|nr:efflux RND transporter periplasmic adaptor subunit [Ectothiorhodospira shaposhnikovii]MCG5512178.1 efflux RND transporter periplasmic adaptor subunit [Ectothiorhodospira shaposhnikovii]
MNVDILQGNTMIRGLVSTCLLMLLALSMEMTMAGEKPITTRSLHDIGFHPVRSAPATALSLNDTQVSAEIHGVLQEVLARVGENVAMGALLARLDCEEHALDLQQVRAMTQAARADAEFAQFQLGRAQELARRQAVSAELLNERQAQASRTRAEVLRLEAATRATQRRVSLCEIRAPFDAVVIERLGSIGELVQPGTPIARILDARDLEVSGNIQQQDLPALQAAGGIRFVAAGIHYPVELRAISPIVDQRLRSVDVRFVFTEEFARPGQVGRIEWITDLRHAPADLLIRRDPGLGIFVEEDGHARFIPIPGVREGQPPPLDLPDDTRLIVDGRFGLQDGDRVSVISP